MKAKIKKIREFFGGKLLLFIIVLLTVLMCIYAYVISVFEFGN